MMLKIFKQIFTISDVFWIYKISQTNIHLKILILFQYILKEKSEERKSPRDEQRQPSPVGSDVPGANKSKIPRITSPTRLTPSPTVSPRKHEEKFHEIENNFLLEKFEEKGEANILRKEYIKIEEYLFFEINEPSIIEEEAEQHFIQKPQVFHSIITDEPSHVEAFGEIERRKRDVEKTDLGKVRK